MSSSSTTGISWVSPRPVRSLAARAVHAIKAEWKAGPPISSKDLFEDMKRQGRREREGRGNSGTASRLDRGRSRTAADVRLEQTYTIAYIAHAPLEPRAAVAEWKDGKLTVWTGTQRPFGVQGELAGAFRLANDAVRVIVPDTGRRLRRQAFRRGGHRGGQAGSRRQADRSSSSGRARKNSPGPTSDRPASSKSRAASAATERSRPGNFITIIPALRGFARSMKCPIN